MELSASHSQPSLGGAAIPEPGLRSVPLLAEPLPLNSESLRLPSGQGVFAWEGGSGGGAVGILLPAPCSLNSVSRFGVLGGAVGAVVGRVVTVVLGALVGRVVAAVVGLVVGAVVCNSVVAAVVATAAGTDGVISLSVSGSVVIAVGTSAAISLVGSAAIALVGSVAIGSVVAEVVAGVLSRTPVSPRSGSSQNPATTIARAAAALAKAAT